jgi:hypothetical protein
LKTNFTLNFQPKAKYDYKLALSRLFCSKYTHLGSAEKKRKTFSARPIYSYHLDVFFKNMVCLVYGFWEWLLFNSICFIKEF